MNPSKIQEKIINTHGNLIVSASAGTGKTFTMVKKIAKELAENKTHKVIAAITFTKKAAQEIKERMNEDIEQCFIGTNNSFAIEEIIKPFMKDVYGNEYNIDMDSDYSIKVKKFDEGVKTLLSESILCAYENNKKNFVFELALDITKKSQACQLYLQSKYFKIYVDEYQDCDIAMHELFMYLCKELKIKLFVVGDEKQSIYIWRGAYPEAFKSIWESDSFESIFMGDNFRSCQQIQNYSNLLCKETRNLYEPTETLDNIVWLRTNKHSWAKQAISYMDTDKKIALLRYTNANAEKGAKELSDNQCEFIYIPHIPISDITTAAAWFYMAIAKYVVLDTYSPYDFISVIPSESESERFTIKEIYEYLENIKSSVIEKKAKEYLASLTAFATYLGYSLKKRNIKKLLDTITNEKYYVAFEPEKYKNIAITLHSSKGLEFDQVILFADDYRLNDLSSINNHYVAITRAKSKVVIVRYENSYNSNIFTRNLGDIFAKCNIELKNIVKRGH